MWGLRRSPKRVWSAEIGSEVAFWDEWLATGGSQWPDEYRARVDPERPLVEYLRDRLQHCDSALPIRILDVGAGPITDIGYRWEGRNLRITAVDPLAEIYDGLLEKHRVTPPVRTTWCHGEALSERFRPETFDLVNAMNSLDHSYDPVRIVEEALRVVKLGGRVVLRHNTNEAEREGYRGLHQWNFCGRGGQFVIWSKSSTTNISRRLRRFAATACTDDGQGVSVTLIKQAPMPARARRLQWPFRW